MADDVKDVLPDTRISTAVGFLRDVSNKNWNEADLKRYLLGNQGLSNEEVKEAFRIYRAKSSRSSRPSRDNIRLEKVDLPKHSRGSRNSSRENIMVGEEKAQFSGPADRPGRSKAISWHKVSPQIRKVAGTNSSYLVPTQKAGGERLIIDFLVREKGYCSVLECLKDDWLKELLKKAKQATINLNPKELKELFSRIPKLCHFHKSFYSDLMLGTNIGRLFIRRFSFFKAYSFYIKDLACIIEMLRKHIFDKQLHKYFGSIRRHSRMANNDLTDLLLAPIHRVLDYKIFLDSLYLVADKAQTVEYQFFGKAARRMGRVAKYIEKYKDGVINSSEMNRAQQYLGNQCLLITPERSIIRRGLITRRTTGWTARNKKYHFFLFTDLLLWTNKNGVLRSAAKLSRCTLLPSHSRIDKARKFKILIDVVNKENPKKKDKVKVLLLQCQTKQQRDTWWSSLEDAMNAVNEVKSEPSAIDEIDYTDKDSDEEEYSKKTTVVYDESWSGEKKLSRAASEDWGSQTLLMANQPYHERYESNNFKAQKFQEFKPIDDTQSQYSDYDHSFYEKFGEYDEVASSSLMSPHRKQSQAAFENEKPTSKPRERENIKGQQGTIESPRSFVIKRNKESGISADNELDIKRTSSLTLRLSDGIIEPDANFIISLSGLNDGVYV